MTLGDHVLSAQLFNVWPTMVYTASYERLLKGHYNLASSHASRKMTFPERRVSIAIIEVTLMMRQLLSLRICAAEYSPHCLL